MSPFGVFCCLFVAHACLAAVRAEKVFVAVYYESLCPDSRKFFTSQLYPNLLNPNVSQWVNLTLVPYGKSTKTNVDNQWQFQCHHGPYECIGNKIQACAIHEIESAAPKKPDQGFNPTTVAFINCLMDKAENISEPGKESRYEFHVANCSEINHVPNYAAIENCRNHPDGSMYLAQLGNVTENLRPPLKSVPTIVFNGMHKMEDSKLARENFVQALCQYIPDNKPVECKSSAASLMLSSAMFALLLLRQLF